MKMKAIFKNSLVDYLPSSSGFIEDSLFHLGSEELILSFSLKIFFSLQK